MILELYLPLYDVLLECDCSIELPSLKTIGIFKKSLPIGHLDIDERFNTINNIGYKHPIVNEIFNKFIELKKSDVGYGNIGNSCEYEYDGNKTIRIKDFFNYLKLINREQIINNITK